MREKVIPSFGLKKIGKISNFFLNFRHHTYWPYNFQLDSNKLSPTAYQYDVNTATNKLLL